MTKFFTKRVYEPYAQDDGYRVLVDRLWPRGISKERAKLDEWAKQIAPSTELRKWFSHDPDKFAVFSLRYTHEVRQRPEAAEIIANWRKYPKVTLLYGARDKANNEAAVLRNYLTQAQ